MKSPDTILDINSEVSKAKTGDKEALLKLVAAEQTELYKLAFVYLRNHSDCEDILQDLIIKLYEQIPKLRKAESFYPWTKKILVNLCRHKLNKTKRTLLLSDPKTTTPNDLFSKQDLENEITRKLDLLSGLSKLTKVQQDVIILHYFADLSIEDVGEVLGCPAGTIKSRLNKGLSNLKKNLGGNYK